MNLLNIGMIGVRLTGVAVISFVLLLGGSAALDQIGKGEESHKETRVDANITTITSTVVKRSFDPLLLAPAGAGLAFGLVLILGSRPIARMLILGLDEQRAVQSPNSTELHNSDRDEKRMPLTPGG